MFVFCIHHVWSNSQDFFQCMKPSGHREHAPWLKNGGSDSWHHNHDDSGHHWQRGRSNRWKEKGDSAPHVHGGDRQGHNSHAPKNAQDWQQQDWQEDRRNKIAQDWQRGCDQQDWQHGSGWQQGSKLSDQQPKKQRSDSMPAWLKNVGQQPKTFRRDPLPPCGLDLSHTVPKNPVQRPGTKRRDPKTEEQKQKMREGEINRPSNKDTGRLRYPEHLVTRILWSYGMNDMNKAMFRVVGHDRWWQDFQSRCQYWHCSAKLETLPERKACRYIGGRGNYLLTLCGHWRMQGFFYF